jgi:PIG-P
LLIPAYTVIVCFLTYFSYFALAIAGTPAFSDMSTITGKSAVYFTGIMSKLKTGLLDFADSRAHLPPTNNSNPYLAHAYPNAIPELYDIPIGMVNRVIYGPRRSTTAAEPVHNI